MDQIVSGDAGNIGGLIIKGPDGIYKISQESTIADTHILDALNYIKQTLPNSYYNTLKAKAAAEKYSPDAMLLTMLIANTSRVASTSYDHSATEDLIGKRASKSSGGSSKMTDEDTYLMRIAQGGE